MTAVSFLRTFRASPISRKIARRAALSVTARVTISFDFDQPRDVATYDEAKRWCATQFGDAFTWSADAVGGTATFGFAAFSDAFLFALWAPSARLH
jgi:hypothetical protein